MSINSSVACQAQNISEFLLEGPYCKPVFDGFLCWSATKAGALASQKCPSSFKINRKKNATKYCEPSGNWYISSETKSAWTNYSQCWRYYEASNYAVEFDRNDEKVAEEYAWFPIMKSITYVGYWCSLMLLIISLLIFLTMRRLYCARNRLHMHLFGSFIMRATTYLLKEYLFVGGVALYSDVVYIPGVGNFIKEYRKDFYEINSVFKGPFTPTQNIRGDVEYFWSPRKFIAWRHEIKALYIKLTIVGENFIDQEEFNSCPWSKQKENLDMFPVKFLHFLVVPLLKLLFFQFTYIFFFLSWKCKLVTSIWNYCILANYMLIVMEGVYLNNLIFAKLISDHHRITFYYCFGWGMPFVFLIPWIILRVKYDDLMCWTTSDHPNISMLVQKPLEITVMINSILFVMILRVLCIKVKSMNLQQRKNKYSRLIRSTLILLMVFGVPYGIFILIYFCENETIVNIWMFYDQVFTAFQGSMVALIYCLLNSEVQTEIKHKYRSVKNRKSDGRRSRNTSQSQPYTTSMKAQDTSSTQKSPDHWYNSDEL